LINKNFPPLFTLGVIKLTFSINKNKTKQHLKWKH
jgi:hypothetical protein